MSNSSEEDLRKQAVKRIKAKRSFWSYVGIWVIVSLILTGVWALSGQGYFWPIWAIGGMGIAALFAGLSAFGPRSGAPSDAEIEREIGKMR
ncbi:MAG: 2TM domain-containing protein [Actinobacteria bacterium]|nr:2TM domain-containing protein [Actinomycetota bacterium]